MVNRKKALYEVFVGGGDSFPILAPPERLWHGPYGRRAIPPEHVQPFREYVHAPADILEIPLTIVAAAIAKGGGTGCMPLDGVGDVVADHVGILHYDVCAGCIRGESVVLVMGRVTVKRLRGDEEGVGGGGRT